MDFFKKAKQTLRELEDYPLLYNKASQLLDEVRSITSSVKKMAQYPKGTQNALKQFQARLTDAREAFKQSPNLNGFQIFAEDCHKALYDYQPKLMAAPGIWNQLKALINNFLERYFNVIPCFDIKKSELALQDDFRQAFDQTKEELSNLIATAEDDCHSSHCFSCC